MAKLDFLGRGAVYSHHLEIPHRLLNVNKEKSFLRKGSHPSLNDNLIIQGDNLYALKSLMPLYEGRIKCIYIDPPYNTGNKGWAYNDNVNSPLMQEWFKKTIDHDDQCRHDKWLCMMWPRLNLLYDLLSEDGVIFISIDDNEQHRLRSIMDEIFGEKNFIVNFNWEKKKKPSFLKRHVASKIEYIVCYSKNQELLESFVMRNHTTTENKKYPINNAGNGISVLEFPPLSVTFGCEDGNILPQDMSEGNIVTELINEVLIKKGKNVNSFRLKGEWRYSQEKINEIITNKECINIAKIPFRPNHVSEGGKPKKIHNLLNTIHWGVGTNEDASNEIRMIFDNNDFEYSKPVSLIKLLINISTRHDDIVLDSFAGSGTTAHATLALNQEDGGNRKFILVECEDYADSITAERVRRVIKGIPNAKEKNLRQGVGGSFTYASLGGIIDQEHMLRGESLPSYEQLARHIFWTATGDTLTDEFTAREDGFIGESSKYHIYLIYKPNIEFLGSDESALSLSKAKAIDARGVGQKKRLVFASVSFMNTEILSDYRIIFCQLPWALHDHLSETIQS